MLPITCHTNLDLANEVWPSMLPEVPRIGDQIESATTHNQFRLTLTVISVIWECYRPETRFDSHKWKPVIELHCLGKSIREFYEWYAPLVGKSVSYFI